MEILVDNLRKHVSYLASEELGGRGFGSDGDRLASEYVARYFRAFGLAAPERYPDYMQRLPWGGQNVLGILSGKEPELSSECLIIDAHQDHMGEGFAGASDNAAGIAAMLEVARVQSERRSSIEKDGPRRSLLFACFDGEESILMLNGKRQLMQGATHYVQNPVFELKKTLALVTLDTLGRKFLSGEILFVLGLERSLSLQDITASACAATTPGLRKIMFNSELLTGVMGNYLPFVNKKIPALFVSNGTHQDYHGRGDTADKISYDLLGEDVLFLCELVERMANLEEKADFCKNPISPKEEPDDILYLLKRLKGAISEVTPEEAGKFDFIIQRLEGSPSRKELRQAVQILLGFATPNLAKLYVLLNEAQNAEKKKDLGEALRYYSQILDLYGEYRVPYLWIQEIRDKVSNLEKKLGDA